MTIFLPEGNPMATSIPSQPNNAAPDPSKKEFSGLSEAEAKEFHAQFRLGTLTFGAVAAAAHVLVYLWKPWFVTKVAGLTLGTLSLLS